MHAGLHLPKSTRGSSCAQAGSLCVCNSATHIVLVTHFYFSHDMSTTNDLEDLNEDALKRILQCLPTDQRRTLSTASKKWQRLISESWVDIDLHLGGKNYLDSASKQNTWLLSLQLQQLQTLRLHFKGFE